MQAEDTVSERLRRWTRILLGSARRGSLSFLSHWTFWAWLYLLQGIHAVGGTERVGAGERLQ